MQGIHDRAYAHHIERLMVIGNFSLLTGVDPWALTEWMWANFIDGAEWVMLPNVIGMALHADGGRMATKPYAAGGAYINKMSDHCKGCRFNPKKRTGDDACPFTSLYWDFLARNEHQLKGNARLGQQLAGMRRLADLEATATGGRGAGQPGSRRDLIHPPALGCGRGRSARRHRISPIGSGNRCSPAGRDRRCGRAGRRQLVPAGDAIDEVRVGDETTSERNGVTALGEGLVRLSRLVTVVDDQRTREPLPTQCLVVDRPCRQTERVAVRELRADQAQPARRGMSPPDRRRGDRCRGCRDRSEADAVCAVDVRHGARHSTKKRIRPATDPPQSSSRWLVPVDRNWAGR